jgi:hypothetical protein
MSNTETDQFLIAIERQNQAFPEEVSISSSYALPIFNTGMAHWNIVDAEGTGDVVATVMFRMPTDTKTQMSQRYMRAVQDRAERLATLINDGLAKQKADRAIMDQG